MAYIASVLSQVILFAIVALGISFFSGRTGYMSLMQAAFLGLGAYVNALLLQQLNLFFLFAWLISTISIFGLAFVLSLPIFRTKDDSFVILTLTLQMLIFLLLVNATPITNGPLGITGIQHFPFSINQFANLTILSIIGVIFLLLFSWLDKTRFTNKLKALHDDEELAMSIGIDVPRLKSFTFALSAGVAAFAGCLYSHYFTYIDPSSFTLDVSILIISIAIIAGFRHPFTIFIASTIVIGVPELFRFLPFDGAASANLKELFYGAVLCLAIMFRFPK